ncbi:IS30 family transposase [Leuconostoc gasicomitatum]|uniref:IS30 family transposase n=1 Tax=Leuconostoc gasicomitatum TaxID=115778 RepID=UPI0007E1A6B9|nr:IS30 family transposase [Leuconostoc gasicomitatum]CUW11214.1 Mobile element protein [Leuconostoc gasicomitatum]
MSYKRIDYEERVQIKTLIDEGLTNAEISRRLFRSRAAITQELKRNARVIKWRGKDSVLRHTYEPMQAHKRAKYKASEAHQKNTKYTVQRQRKIDYLIKKELWSPEQIANGVPNIGISARTIYNWILKRKLNSTIHDLPLKGKRRRHLRAKKTNKASTRAILETRSIKKRPKVINQRDTFGHWEIDGVMSPQNSQNFVITLVERRTRYMVAVKTKSRNYTDVKTAIDTFMSKFEFVCHSLTCDRGVEFTSTTFINTIETVYKKKLFFADPQSPGQRGTNERLNRELRRFYPTGYDFSKITQKRLQTTIKLLNERPRMVLGYKTPASEFIKRMPHVA